MDSFAPDLASEQRRKLPEPAWTMNRLKRARSIARTLMEQISVLSMAGSTVELVEAVRAFIHNRDIRNLGVNEAANKKGGETPGVDGRASLTRIEQLSQAERLWSEAGWAPRLNVEIPKGDGTTRTITIATIRDRSREHVLTRAVMASLNHNVDPAHYCVRGRGELKAYGSAATYLQEIGPCAALVADIKGFYNNIPVQRLFEVLGLPADIECLIRPAIARSSLFSGLEDLQVGIPQGSPLSAELGLQYLNGLGSALVDAAETATGTPAFAAIYVDNVLILHPHRAGLEACARVLHAFIEERGLELGSADIQTSAQCAGTDMPIAPSIRYMAAEFEHYLAPVDADAPEGSYELRVTLRASDDITSTRDRMKQLRKEVPAGVVVTDDTFHTGSFEDPEFCKALRTLEPEDHADAESLLSRESSLILRPGFGRGSTM